MKSQMKGNKMPIKVVPIKNKKKPQPKKLKDVMNKKFKQEAEMRNSVYRSTVRKKPPSKGAKKFLEGIDGTGPDFQYKVEKGKATKRAINDTIKSMKKDSPELMKRVMKKKSGGVMKANMGRLLETFSPAYSVMKGKGPIANILGMAKGNKVDPMQTEMEKAKKLEAMRAAAKSGTQSNRMALMSSPTRMKAGGSIKKKKSIDGIATKGRTRA